ncbi:Putative phage serine protease XkdF, partial [Thermoactinomyces sp. DSM 45891]|uniref:XkdF-like putative serine protease domain-containing protein n=1 Tax=Thermoactinomyces sp. DSM 45891 TaxID=1761907 RepID=UPI00090EF0C4
MIGVIPKGRGLSIELIAPFIQKNHEKRIVYGPVLVPNEPDHDGDKVNTDKIEEVAHRFVEKYANIDLQHSLNNVGSLVETYITPVDLTFDDVTVPQGSWMLGVRVTDESVWSNVKKGKLTGFSIMGIPQAVMKSQSNQEIQASLKRITLKDLGEDWIVNAVSLVDEPCVPKAKFLVVKSKEKEDTPDGLFAKLKQLISSHKSVEESTGGEQMDKEEIQSFVEETVKKAIHEAVEEIRPSIKEEREDSPVEVTD